ncbi:MAG: enoyl-[acyl-carrier-protein] reductase FabI [Bdellovibrionaceae bacterium]|nr:enoyl-[acyl-carrier-protein] reductase FabI [Pseudobdellovibrionaceae bacterium]
MNNLSRPLEGKKALIFGVANERSLAWGIAQQLKEAGAEIALTYLGESMERRVRPLGEKLEATLIEPCDVQNEKDLDALFSKVQSHWGTVDILIHSIAFAQKEELEGRFIDTTAKGFGLALQVSAYSLVELSRRCEPLMPNGSRILTLSYLGAEKVVPNYNVMGVAKAALEASVRYLASDLGEKKITVNAISAGPVKTLAAVGIRDFRKMLSEAKEKTPLKETIEPEDVGALASFLCGPGGKRITGTTLYVDSGAHIMGA